jgi:thymidylate synthase
MPISLICSVVNISGKMAIGYSGDLLARVPEDLHFFKSVTRDSLLSGSVFEQNVVVMGKNTWKSIGNKPLPGRINIVLLSITSETRSIYYGKTLTHFMTFSEFKRFYSKNVCNVFVIGGGIIYNLFLKDHTLAPTKLYITHISGYKLPLDFDPEKVVYIGGVSNDYSLVGWGSEQTCITSDSQTVSMRILHYRKQDITVNTLVNSVDLCYSTLVYDILETGLPTPDRTGVGTRSIFGKSIKLNIGDGNIPLLTTKFVPIKGVIEELLFFIRGDTDSRILMDRGVNIWKGNSTREFLDDRGLEDYSEYELGPVYGYQWRYWGRAYIPLKKRETHTTRIRKGVDQLSDIIKTLKCDPFSRRMVLSAWDPQMLNKMVLPPCHLMCIFKVTLVNGKKHLNCHLICRSTDVGLGLPFNLASYAILTYILAAKVDMLVGELFYTGTDVHIYNNHIAKLSKICGVQSRPQPKLKLASRIRDIPFEEIELSDFELVGYFPRQGIKLDMAI